MQGSLEASSLIVLPGYYIVASCVLVKFRTQQNFFPITFGSCGALVQCLAKQSVLLGKIYLLAFFFSFGSSTSSLPWRDRACEQVTSAEFLKPDLQRYKGRWWWWGVDLMSFIRSPTDPE